MENPRKLSDSVEKVTLTGDEMVIGLDGREIKIKLSVLKTYLGIVASGNVVPARVPGLDLGAPDDAKFYVGGPGTYTLNGVTEQYSDVVNFFFWDKSSWEVLEIPIEVPQPDLNGLVKETEYQSDVANRFNKDEEQLFQSANYPVRRYMTGDAITNYSPGYRQTATPNGLQMDIPASGTTSIKHYIQTNFTPIGTTLIEFSLNGTGLLETSGVGVGYIADNGNYVGFYLSGSGQFRKVVNYGQVFTATASGGYGNGETVVFQIQDNTLTIKKGDSTLYSYPLEEDELSTPLLIMQSGFPRYIFKAESKIAPIDDWVKREISAAIKSDALPKCFYKYDPTGVVNSGGGPNTGLFTVFVNIGLNYYTGFHVGHEVDMRELQWKDYWRIRNATLYEYNGYEMADTGMKALHDGESECVWKRNSNKDDFTGGTHGDEIVQEVLFFANGVNIASWARSGPGASNPGFASMALTACNDFYYLEKSTMHESANKDLVPIPGHPLECYHIKQTHFGNAGYKTWNRLVWERPGLVTLWYHAICCMHVNFSGHLYSEDYVQHSTAGDSPGLPRVPEFRKVWFRNDERKTSSFVTSRITKVLQGGVDITLQKDQTAELFVSDRSSGGITGDDKLYREMSPINVAQGDVCESEMEVRFAVNF
jgi:hypothetical protein